MTTFTSSNLGYPRIGANREWKKALEQYWASKIDQEALLAQLEEIRLTHLRKQKDNGMDLIPVGDFTFYDHVLDTAVMFGVIPERFGYSGGEVSLDTYFAMARGRQDAVACEMTKWLDTNYHYIVPELDGATPQLTQNLPLKAYVEAKEKLNIDGKPVLVGPYSFIKLAKGYQPDEWVQLLDTFVPLYIQVLHQLAEAGANWVQIDEPVLVTSIPASDMDDLQRIYTRIREEVPESLSIMLQTYFESVEHYEQTVQLPVDGIGLDFVAGKKGNMNALRTYGFPKTKVLGIGIVDGRNVWRNDLNESLDIVREITDTAQTEQVIIQPSASLLFVPITIEGEDSLPNELKQALAFADEKLTEINVLTRAANDGLDACANEFGQCTQAIEQFQKWSVRHAADVREDVSQLGEADAERDADYAKRLPLQQAKWNFPILPTTTIGSFPQTNEVRTKRLQWRRGDIDDDTYRAYIQDKINEWIDIQHEIGLDVLVHGEFERTDMVEYFGQRLGGFAFTKKGWVQSYGSRGVRPPIIFGDVQFQKPMTVDEVAYAQTLTDKPVKGMLTGPTTIVNWSFVREDISRADVAKQIALALRKEVQALEAANIEIIQVDEPALREGLPLKSDQWQHYLDWAVYAFRVTTAAVQSTTQIHTHMCYSEFHDIIDAIRAMDADVISIETSRSHGELIRAFEENDYEQGIGLGVYDIHSPRVPEASEIEAMIRRSLRVLEQEQFWINPDCGLKTRGVPETVAALRNMVQATKQVREALQPTT